MSTWLISALGQRQVDWSLEFEASLFYRIPEQPEPLHKETKQNLWTRFKEVTMDNLHMPCFVLCVFMANLWARPVWDACTLYRLGPLVGMHIPGCTCQPPVTDGYKTWGERSNVRICLQLWVKRVNGRSDLFFPHVFLSSTGRGRNWLLTATMARSLLFLS